jgi:hypothetical protein
MAAFERRLWSHLRRFMDLAASRPSLLVDCARVVELQEAMDTHYAAAKVGYVRPKHYKERALAEMGAAVSARFQPLLALCRQHGVPNSRVSFICLFFGGGRCLNLGVSRCGLIVLPARTPLTIRDDAKHQTLTNKTGQARPGRPPRAQRAARLPGRARRRRARRRGGAAAARRDRRRARRHDRESVFLFFFVW